MIFSFWHFCKDFLSNLLIMSVSSSALQLTSGSALCVKLMDGGNRSCGVWIFAVGIAQFLEIQILLFLFFTVFYIASMLGNLLIVLTTLSDHYLHSPSVLFVGQSLLHWHRQAYTNPVMIFWLKTQSHLLERPLTDVFIHAVGAGDEVLKVMAYDPHGYQKLPLISGFIMSLRMCSSLLAVAWPLDSSTCGPAGFCCQLHLVPVEMDSFYCDFPRFIKLACTDTHRLEFLVTANSGFISHGHLLYPDGVLHLHPGHSSQTLSGGSSKALSTLSAHIIRVVFSLALALLSMCGHSLPYP